MIKIYDFQYISAWDATVSFEVDSEIFTPEKANDTLWFFVWDYDKKNDPIDEVMKKYAIEAIKQATFNNYSEEGVIEAFNDNEGYYPIDGRFGIKLTEVTPLSFNDSELSVEIKEKGNN